MNKISGIISKTDVIKAISKIERYLPKISSI
jgi:hypothetical protein